MLERLLTSLRPTEPAPTWATVRSSPGFEQALGTLSPEACAELASIIVECWGEAAKDDRDMVLDVLAKRVPLLEDGQRLWSALDALVWACLATSEGELGTGVGATLADGLADLLERDLPTLRGLPSDDIEVGEAALRSRAALGATVDLIMAAAAHEFRLLGWLQRISADPPPSLASPLARAAGRLGELADHPMLGTLLERCLAQPDAAGDAAVEMGHRHVRTALRGEADDPIEELRRARRMYADAERDEHRPDATAYGLALDAVLAFAAGASRDALDGPLDELQDAVTDLIAYSDDGDAPSRTLRLGTAWLEMAGRIRAAARGDRDSELLDPQSALTPLLGLYADTRLRVIDGPQDDLAIVLHPPIERWIADEPVRRATLDALARRLPEGSELRQAAEALASLTGDSQGKAWKFRCQPGSPGRWGLHASRRRIPTRRRPPCAPSKGC